jgi:hypothetical protein
VEEFTWTLSPLSSPLLPLLSPPSLSLPFKKKFEFTQWSRWQGFEKKMLPGVRRVGTHRVRRGGGERERGGGAVKWVRVK